MMTNIFMRNRKDTPFKVSLKAIELSSEIIKVLNREKNIPKHHGIFYLNKIDHYITDKLGYKYGRYMDDSYVICNDKNKLKELIYILQDKLKSYNIKINMKKTHIANITNAILYLKTRFFILKSGKILKLPVRKNVSKERLKLKKQYKLFKENILITYEIYRSYISWRGSLLYKNCHKTILKTDQLYKGLFS